MRPVLDHVVVTVPDLDEAVLAFTRDTGVQPVMGGTHPRRGTRNALVALSWRGACRRYLELLGPDPEQGDVPADAVMLDAAPALGDGPRVHAWAVRIEDGDPADFVDRGRSRGLDMGEFAPGRRIRENGSELRWRMAVPRPLGFGGLQPFVVDYDGEHPTEAIRPGVELLGLHLAHPEPDSVAGHLAALGLDGDLDLAVAEARQPSLRITVRTPDGPLTL